MWNSELETSAQCLGRTGRLQSQRDFLTHTAELYTHVAQHVATC